jgi:PAS domain S-box-containing protein
MIWKPPRWMIVILSALAAVLLTILSGEPALLLVGLTFACVVGGQRTGAIVATILVIVFVLHTSLRTPELTGGYAYLALRSAIFAAAAAVIVALINSAPVFASAQGAAIRFAAATADNMPAMSWSMDANGDLTYRNRGVWDYVGGNRHRDARENWQEMRTLVHPDDWAMTAETLARSLASGADFHFDHRILRHDGAYLWFRSFARAERDSLGNIRGWYGTSVDVHDHKLAEQARSQSEGELRQLVETIPVLIWSATPEGEPSYVNRQLTEYAGVTPEDLDVPGRTRLAEALATTVHPEDSGRIGNAMKHSFSTGEPFAAVYRIRRHDGVYRWVDSRLAPLRDREGNIVRWYGAIVDIDESKRAEEALRNSERQLKLLVDTMPAMVWCASASGEPTYFNKRLNDYMCIPAESLAKAGRTPLDLAFDEAIHPEDRDELRRVFAQSFAGGQSFSLRYRMRRSDGAYRSVDSRSEPLRDEEDRVLQWYTVISDIDDEKRMQEELRSAHERLSSAAKAVSLAELSASIAHEVNQPLAGIAANSEACERWLSADPPNIQRAIASVNRIVRDAHSAAEVVSRIRALFQRQAGARTSVDINELILEICRLMVNETKAAGIQVRTDLEQALPSPVADRIQLQQVLINLIRNGIEALDAQPRENRVLEIRSLRRAAGNISVVVRDHGPGVEDPHRIFEAFFSSKRNGMGMGLAICRSIIDAHEGEIWAENSDGGGATFTFTLPTLPPDARAG